MKEMILITFMFAVSLVAVSQTKVVVTDSVVGYKMERLSLSINNQPRGFFKDNERVLYGLRTPIAGVTYNPFSVGSTYHTNTRDRLNPYRNSDPLGAVLIGTFNYFIDKAIYSK